MRWIEMLLHRLRSIFFPSQVERELSDELEFHAAQGRLVGAEQIKEECRDARGVGWLEDLKRDFGFAARLLRRNPGFSALAITTLALGIGATTAIFGVVDAVLLRPLPFPEPDRLVRLWEGKVGAGPMRNVVNGWNFLDWQERSRSFVAMAAIDRNSVDITGEGEPVSVAGMNVSTDFFPILRVQPLLGRWFTKEEGTAGHDDKVILSYGLWQDRFGGDRNVLGRRITVRGSALTIVGVMPQGFTFVTAPVDLWTPMPIARNSLFKSGRFLTTVARLKPGVTAEAAAREMQDVARRSAQERPDFNRDWTAEVVPVLDGLVEGVRRPLLILLGAVGCLLLIACANVANLLLMRGAERTREMAVRASLGAGSARLLRQLVTESLLLALMACTAGILLARVLLSALPVLLSDTSFLPRMDTIHVDARVLWFAAGTSVVTAVLFGMFPAIRLARVELQEALKQGARGASAGNRRFRQVFVTAQVALALILLAGAGLLGRSFARLVAVDPGFRTRHLLTMNFSLGFSQFPFSQPQKRADYIERVVQEVRAAPGVQSASTVHMLPLQQLVSGSCYGRVDEAAPTPANSPSSQFLIVGTDYLKTMGIALNEGREFLTSDRIGAPSVAIVTRSFAAKVFPGESAVGKQIRVCWSVPNPVQIVGVSADIRQTTPEKAPRETVFLPNLQTPTYGAGLVIETENDPASEARTVEAAIHRVNPNQAVSGVRTMDELFAQSVAQPRFQSLLLGVFAALALAIAAIGVYGVVGYSVTQRTREIGIRVVLGATRRGVAAMVLKEGIVLTAGGVVLGLAGAFWLSQLLSDLLFEVRPTDPPTLIAVSALLAATAALAACIPARRATRIAPVVALRDE